MGASRHLEHRVAAFFETLAEQPVPVRYGALLVESAVWSAVSFGVPWLLGARGTQLGVFCLFLTAVSLHGRFEFLLTEHRALIFDRGWVPRRAHVTMAASVLALFLGVCASYAALVDLAPTSTVDDTFGWVLSMTGADRGDLLTRQFSDTGGVLRNNMGVMVAVTALGLVFRGYGAVLVLGWNASTWVVALTSMTQRAADVVDMSAASFRGVAALAVMPHLVLELFGYVLAAMAGIFVSRAIVRYDWEDQKLTDILASSGAIFGVSVGGLVIGAVVEATVPGWVLSSLVPPG